MSRLFPDTDPEAERVLIELLSEAPVTRKLEMLAETNAADRHWALQGLRARHPEASEPQLRGMRADLLLGPELAARAYGPPPCEKTHAC